MRRIAIVALIAIALAPRPAHGDGGVVRLSQAAGPFTITVFTAPTPLRAGPIDVSVLVQDGRTGDTIDDAVVEVVLRGRDDPSQTVRAPALHEQATNKLLYAALLEMPVAGGWHVTVDVAHAGTTATVGVDVDAEPALPPWRAYWPYFALPPLALSLYALNQWLTLRR